MCCDDSIRFQELGLKMSIKRQFDHNIKQYFDLDPLHHRSLVYSNERTIRSPVFRYAFLTVFWEASVKRQLTAILFRSVFSRKLRWMTQQFHWIGSGFRFRCCSHWGIAQDYLILDAQVEASLSMTSQPTIVEIQSMSKIHGLQ